MRSAPPRAVSVHNSNPSTPDNFICTSTGRSTCCLIQQRQLPCNEMNEPHSVVGEGRLIIWEAALAHRTHLLIEQQMARYHGSPGILSVILFPPSNTPPTKTSTSPHTDYVFCKTHYALSVPCAIFFHLIIYHVRILNNVILIINYL